MVDTPNQISFSSIKEKASAMFKLRYGLALGASLAVPLLLYFPSLVSVLRSLPLAMEIPAQTNASFDWYAFFIMPVRLLFNIGMARIFISIYREEEAQFSDVFLGFKDAKRNLIGMLPLMGANLLGWISATLASFPPIALTLSIAALVIEIGLWMTPYLLAESGIVPPERAAVHSWRMMQGQKMEYVKFSLPFIGWMLLTVVTAGLAFFFVAPYMAASYAGYYSEISKRFDQ